MAGSDTRIRASASSTTPWAAARPGKRRASAVGAATAITWRAAPATPARGRRDARAVPECGRGAAPSSSPPAAQPLLWHRIPSRPYGFPPAVAERSLSLVRPQLFRSRRDQWGPEAVLEQALLMRL